MYLHHSPNSLKISPKRMAETFPWKCLICIKDSTFECYSDLKGLDVMDNFHKTLPQNLREYHDRGSKYIAVEFASGEKNQPDLRPRFVVVIQQPDRPNAG